MAAKTKRAKTSAAKKSPPKQAPAPASNRVLSDRVISLLWITVFCLLAVITMFSFGWAGRMLNHICGFLIGTLQYPLFVCLIAYSIWFILQQGKKRPPERMAVGFVFLCLFWCFAFALAHTSADNPWSAFQVLIADMPQIADGSFFSWYGLAGAVLAGIFVSLFSKAGAWLVCLILLALGFVLVFWSVIFSAYDARKKQKENEQLQSMQQEYVQNEKKTAKSSEPVSLKPTYLFGEGDADFSSDSPSAAYEQEMQRHYNDLQETETEEKTSPLALMGLSLKRKKKKSAQSRFDIDISGWTKKKTPEVQESVTEKPEELEEKSISEPEKPARTLPKAAPGKRKPAETQEKEPDFKVIDSAKPKRKAAKSRKAETADEDILADTVISTETKPEEPVSSKPGYNGDLSKYKLPPASLLQNPPQKQGGSANAVQARTDGEKLIKIFDQFGVEAKLSEIHIGPSVTKYEVIPGAGVRVNTFVNLQNDIKMALAATDIRVEAPIPGKSAVGIEVPNAEKTTVYMKDLIRQVPARLANLPLVFALGKDLTGDNVYGRLDSMPHLLIAGATGSGKSVCVNSIICSILMRTRPDEVKLILIDPKKVEFTPYNDVPHLLSPVITDSELAGKALKTVAVMMDHRYELFEEARVRNISAYNAWVEQNPDAGMKKLPRMVVIIDELADLMISAPKEVEQSIQRITQLARAAGIHLIVATQRPSVNVITGVIKANIPSRIAFAVSSSTDSRTILDQSGAERLFGYGDMLFLDNGDTSPRRIQGVFIQDEEVNAICDFVKKQALPMYDDAFIALKDLSTQGGQPAPEKADPLYNEVKNFVISSQKASTSLIQRRFSLGYGRAARILDILESTGVVGPSQGSRGREVLVSRGDMREETQKGAEE